MEWSIRSRSRECWVTGRPFEQGDAMYTVLIDGSEGLERKDMCAEAWKNRDSNMKMISFWKSIFKPGEPQVQKETLEKEDAETELRKLVESDEPADIKAAFLMGAFLERKRILRVVDRAKIDGQKATVYEHFKTQETFIIRDPDLSLAELEELREDLQQSASALFAIPVEDAPGPDSTDKETTGTPLGASLPG